MQRAKEMKIMEMRLWGSSQKRSVKWLRNSKLAEKKKRCRKRRKRC